MGFFVAEKKPGPKGYWRKARNQPTAMKFDMDATIKVLEREAGITAGDFKRPTVPRVSSTPRTPGQRVPGKSYRGRRRKTMVPL